MSIRRGFAFLAGCLCVGCVGAPDGGESDEPAEPAVALDAEPDHAPSVSFRESLETTPGRARLLERYARGARETVCIEVDGSGAIATMDEWSCAPAVWMHECAPDDCPWVECGGCLLYLEQKQGAPWTLTAHMDSHQCRVFAGKYAIEVGASCVEHRD